ncbi:MAG: carbohydrate-binding domain-containing protein, partial [Planctomycetota bacterium]
ADGVVPGFRESEFLHANGFFDYGAAPSGGGDGSIVQIFADGFTGEESLELRIDGQVVASYSNIPIAGRVYSFQSNEVVSADQIEIAFTNDNFGSGDPDRNLNVDKISIDGVDYETEAPTVFSTGTWKPQDGIVPGFRESETLHANGVFRYDAQSSDPDPNADPGTIVVRVAGTTGDERIELQLDGQTVATYDTLGDQANVGGFREFTFQATGPVDPGRVRIAFVNDLLDTAAGIDRNVRIDHVRIDGQIFETESPDVFSTGTWLPADGIAPGFRQSETLHANGYFQFANANNNPGFIGLGATQYTVNEDDGSITFSLTRVEGTNGPASVFYQTVSGDALSGDDFIGNDSGRVDFVDGQSTANASIALVNDDQIEGIENFSISLFRAEGAQLGEPRTAIVTIVDDESGRDLIGNWRLDESSISDGVIDSSDNANTGTFRNFDPNDIVSGPRPDAPSVASGNGGAIFFDGQNDYIQIGPDAALDVSEGTFSQSVWIKPTDNNNGTYQGVLGYQDGGTSTRYPGIWVYQQDRIHTGFGDGSNWNSFNSGSVLTVDQWNHVATTFDGTEYIIYVNGAQVAST